MEKYLISYHFSIKKESGFGHIVLSIKGKVNVKEVKEYIIKNEKLDKVVILNIIKGVE